MGLFINYVVSIGWGRELRLELSDLNINWYVNLIKKHDKGRKGTKNTDFETT